jgi:hypothetical protein
MLTMTRTEKIIQIAKSYIGMLEIKSNAGFYDASFSSKMKEAGWYMSAPWCAFFTKHVYKEAYADNKSLSAVIRGSFTGGAIDTLKRIKADPAFRTGIIPKPGAIVVWRLGKTGKGHVGIVVSADLANNTMITIEGNTNNSGSREGDCVAQKIRTIIRPFKNDGLNVEGYIYALEV